MYRDPTLAAKSKEIARLREELKKAQENDGDLERQLAEAEAALAKARAKKPRKPARQYRAEFNEAYRSFTRGMPNLSHSLLVCLLFFLLGFCVYRYATDIQEGVVTSKAYHPPQTTCTTTDGVTTCTTSAPSWSVDVAYEGRTASWHVSHDRFNSLQQGEWFCYVDIFHSADKCRGNPTATATPTAL